MKKIILTLIVVISVNYIAKAQTLDYCVGDKIELTNSTSATNGAGVTYKWTKGTSSTVLATTQDYLIANSATTSHAGIYKLVVTKNGCDSDVAQITVNVNSLPTPTLTNDATSNTICAGESVTFTAGGGAEYQFFVNGSSVQARSNDNTYDTSSLSSGDKVKVKVWNSSSADACSKESAETTITVNSVPTPTLTNDATSDTICAGESVTFTAGGGTQYQFFVNGSSVQARSNDNTYDTSSLSNGDKVKVKVWNGSSADACSKESAETTITVKPLPNVTNLTVDNATVCTTSSGQNITFTVTGTANATITYTINSGTPQTKVIGASGTVDITVSGATTSQTLAVTKVTSGGCDKTITESETATVTIKPTAVIIKK